MNLTICMTTARQEPNWHWAVASLKNQVRTDDNIKFMVIDSRCPEKYNRPDYFIPVTVYPPKPNVWQGAHRLTKQDWWAVCNARNTALCLCETNWICFIDDRCVLADGWLDAVRDAVAEKYIMAGSYEKRHNMKVESYFIVDPGITVAKDGREDHAKSIQWKGPMPCGGEWLFGCCVAMPLEWALRVNGLPELLSDSLSFEDVLFGMILKNNFYPIRFDARAKIIEDRTPELLGEPMKRTCKERFPNDTKDKAHMALAKVRTMKRSENPFGDIRELRAKIQAGEPFPVLSLPERDWYDGQLVKDFI